MLFNNMRIPYDWFCSRGNRQLDGHKIFIIFQISSNASNFLFWNYKNSVIDISVQANRLLEVMI